MSKKVKTVDSFCRGCIYLAKMDNVECWCDYIGAEGHRRPCPAGKGCTVKKAGRRSPKALNINGRE